jgi:hypothetical protein
MADQKERGTKASARRKEAGPAARRKKPQESSAARTPELLREVCRQLTELTGHPAESVSSLARTDDGWALEVEVLEVERIPDTTSLLATYEVTLDEEKRLAGYRRTRRYERGRADPR